MLILLVAATLTFDPAVPNASQVQDYLTAKHSALASNAPQFIDLGRQYDVDPRLVAAIAGAETTFGKNVCADYNAWNWFHRGTCPESAFTSYEEGLQHVTKFMRRSYLNKGYTSIELIQAKYCVKGCENWTPLVTRFYDEMPSVAGRVGTQAPSRPTPVAGEVTQLFGIPLPFIFFGAALIVLYALTKVLRPRR
jgi:hypothetical protein